MNIWIVNHYGTPPSQPGITRHFMLGGELVRLGHKVTIVASSFDHVTQRELHLRPGESTRLEEIDEVSFVWVRTPAYSGNGIARMVNMASFGAQLLRPSVLSALPRPDVIIGSSPTLFAAYAAMMIAKRMEVPFVLEVRDLWPSSLVDIGGVSAGHPAVRIMGLMERKLYRDSSHIISLLRDAQSYMVERGAVPGQVDWLPNGVDMTAMAPPLPPRANKVFTVTYAGAHGFANGLEVILEAAAILSERQQQNIRIRFIGDGPNKVPLQEYAAQRNLRNVQFDSAVPKDRIFEVLADSDAFVNVLRGAALYRFGISPNKLYDYMAMGRPVVLASDNSTGPITDAGCGIVVPSELPTALAEAFETLAALTPEQRWEMGLRGRRFVERNHDISRLGKSLEKLLQSVVHSCGRAQEPTCPQGVRERCGLT